MFTLFAAHHSLTLKPLCLQAFISFDQFCNVSNLFAVCACIFPFFRALRVCAGERYACCSLGSIDSIDSLDSSDSIDALDFIDF